MQLNSFHVACSPSCARMVAKDKIAKKEARVAKARRADTRRRKQEMETLGQVKGKTQVDFNTMIRELDYGLPCISCGREDHEIPEKFTGGKWDCGHYHSVGAREELRFEVYNAHRQCKVCNGGSGKYARKNYTVAAEYHERLIKRIGPDKVAWLDGPHPMPHYRKEELRVMAAEFRKITRELRKERDDGVDPVRQCVRDSIRARLSKFERQ